MAAGLGFKTFNTGDVLSAGDTNGYLMQGVLVFADAAARTAAIASPQEGQTSYLKDTDVIQVYSGSAWVTKSGAPSPLTTKGDVYTYSTADARIAVGANDTVLTADSSTATGLKWAAPSSGGMTLLYTDSLASLSSLTISGISQDYKELIIDLSYFNLSTGSGGTIWIRPNNNTSTYRFFTEYQSADAGNENQIRFVQNQLGSDGGYAAQSRARLHIFDYTYSQGNGRITGELFSVNQADAGGFFGNHSYWIATGISAAITSLTFGATATLQRGTIKIYGVK
jgi:hypothetical protein